MANLRIKYKRARRECARLRRMVDISADAGFDILSELREVQCELNAARREADKLGMELADAEHALRAAKQENGRLCRILEGVRRHPVGRLVYAAIERKGGFWDGEG